MVDDLLAISKCGVQSIETNTSINTLIELKKLQFHTPNEKKAGKCHFFACWPGKQSMSWNEGSWSVDIKSGRNYISRRYYSSKWQNQFKY